MVWAFIYGSDGLCAMVCPALDAQMWNLLEGDRWWRYHLVPAD